jgi:hypothetical protein
VDVREDIVDDEDLIQLKTWDQKLKASKLSKVGYGWPRELLEKLLEKNPCDRPGSWHVVIDELNQLGTNGIPRSPETLYDRVVVFRSDPLVYVNSASKSIIPLGRMDFEKEADVLVTSLRDADAVGANIDVVFESATTDALSAFFAQRSSRVLHFSGHGHPKYLALEDGFGQLQTMLVDDLKRYVSQGGGNLQLAVVSACHSRDTGEAFVKAGIPHVVCCQLEEQLLDASARVFSGNFYRALACGSNLREAFDMAREAVRVSPQVENSTLEAGKFLLLPEQGVDHDIPVFFTKPVPLLSPANRIQMNAVHRLPDNFVGRDMCMYEVITALNNADVVRVSGVSGVGKSCVVSAVCSYIMQRPRSFPMDYFYWFQASSTSISRGDANSPYQELSTAFHAIFEDRDLAGNKDYYSSLGRLSTVLGQKRIYLVINVRESEKDGLTQKVEQFIRDLLDIASVKLMKIILISSTTEMGTQNMHGRHEASVVVGPLDFEKSVVVFSSHLPLSLRSRYQGLCLSPMVLARHLSPVERLVNEPSFNADFKELWLRLGEGIPGQIRSNAMKMTVEDMATIVNWWANPK